MVDGFSDFADACEDFADDLEDARDRLHDEMDIGVKDTADDMTTEMKRKAPSDSGTLQNSITRTRVPDTTNDVEYRLGPEADYAHWVEYGTGLHGPKGERYTILPESLSESEFAAAQAEAQAAAEQAADEYDDPDKIQEAAFAPLKELVQEHGGLDIGADHPVVKVSHPGSEAQPYFHPTVTRAVEERWLTRNLEDALDDVFRPVARH